MDLLSKLSDKELIDCYNAIKIQETILVAMTFKRELTKSEYIMWMEHARNLPVLEDEMMRRFPNFKLGEII